MNAIEQPAGRAQPLSKIPVVAQSPRAESVPKARSIAGRAPDLRRASDGGGGHYRAYKPRPFTREERAGTTILFGGLHWRVERLIQGAMENLGYRAQILPTATRA